MTETLQQPIPDEQLAAAVPSEMTGGRKQEIYNSFNHDRGALSDLARDIDRLQLGGREHQTNVDLLEGRIEQDTLWPKATLHDYYERLVDAATVVPDAECEEIWGSITEGHLAGCLSNLGRGYRYVKARGMLTEYALPSSGATGGMPSGEAEEAKPPLDTVRRPVPLDDADVARLVDSPEAERIVLLSEMLDPYRFRHDHDAPDAERRAQIREKDQIMSLLASMNESWERDLLAVEAWKFFRYPAIGDARQARQAVDLISVPEFRRAIAATDAKLSDYEPATVAASFRTSGKKALAMLEKKLKLSNETVAEIDSEARAAEPDMAVIVNIGLPQLARALFDSHRLLPLGETKESGGNDYGEAMVATENLYGFYDAQQGDVWPRPVYGSVAWSRDEMLRGPVENMQYGDCIVTLKRDVARRRALYTYGDSRDTESNRPDLKYNPRVMAYAEMPAAKVIFEKYDTNPDRKKDFIGSERYIEAQILGGVEIDDMESITLPWARAIEDVHLIWRIRDLYPSLSVRVTLDKATAEKAGAEALRDSAGKLGVDYIVLD